MSAGPRARRAATLLPAALALAALAVRLAPPSLGAWLIFDRAAVVERGEWWRVASSALVHFSWTHAVGDAVVLVTAGLFLDARRPAAVVALLLGAMAASGLAVLALAPELRWYGGLSGVAHATVVYAALGGARRGGAEGALSLAVLGAIAAKLLVDAGTVRHLAASHAGAPVVVADVAHRAAAALAVALHGAVALAGRLRSLADFGHAPHRGSAAERVGRATSPFHAGGSMHPVRVVFALSAAAVMLGAAGWQRQRQHDRPLVSEGARAAHARAEVVRLRAHFDSVDAELRARDVSHLAPAQRAARLRLIAWLRDYRDAGRFPANDVPGAAPVPFFRDAHGTLCAMAYLIDRSGRGDFVDRVARTNNTAYVRELADDATLVAWLDSTGLSAAEAARIQPTYGGPTPGGNIEDGVSGDYALTSLLLGGASLATTSVNIVRPTRGGGLLGLLFGGATLASGVSRLDDGGDTQKVAVAGTVVGVAAIAAGVRALLASRTARLSGGGPVTTSGSGSTARLDVVPAMLPGGARGEARRLGMVVSARF